MEQIKLKNIPIPVPRLCCGGCPAGEYGWGKVDHHSIEAAIRRAYELGICFFDTADTYGLGTSESNMGRVLHDVRSHVVFASKFGVRVENGKTFYDNSPAYIEKALSESLKRLQTDYIDLYQIHYLDGVTPIDEMMEALLRMKKEGRILSIGLSNILPEQALLFAPYADAISSFQTHFSLAHRETGIGIRKIAETLSAVPLTWGSLGQGILTGKYDASAHFESNDRRSRTIYDNFHGEKLRKNLRIVEKMRPIAEAHHVPVSAVAIRWILDHLPDSVAITGMKTAAQAESNALALQFTLSEDEIRKLNEVSDERSE